MDVFPTNAELRAHLRGCPRPITFVPTMGALHEGHLSLMRIGRRRATPSGTVVASIFVNPTQFAPHEDFAAYPRTLEADLAACRTAGVDVAFTPARDEIHLPDASTRIVEDRLSLGLCGTSRPHFFGGVCTVVAKLFHIVGPDVAVFGEKDFQQLAVIRRMVRDLHWPIEILSGPIVRESDGLAMSSRNRYLGEAERRDALALHRALERARLALEAGERDVTVLRRLIEDHLQTAPLVRTDYIRIVDPDTLELLSHVSRQALVALAAFVGATRLIDNLSLRDLPS